MSQKRLTSREKSAPLRQFKHQLQKVLADQAAAKLRAQQEREAARLLALRAETSAAHSHREDSIFHKAMADVAPLISVSERVPAAERERPILPTEDELAVMELRNIVEGQVPFAVHESEEALFGAAPGVSNMLLDQLRHGQFAYQHHLDLHGLTRDAAHLQVAHFIAQSRRQSERCVLIVTGRGRSSPDGHSVLRNALPRWLSRAPVRPHVLAFSTARAHDGGAGAFYVLLRRPGVPPFGSGL